MFEKLLGEAAHKWGTDTQTSLYHKPGFSNKIRKEAKKITHLCNIRHIFVSTNRYLLPCLMLLTLAINVLMVITFFL